MRRSLVIVLPVLAILAVLYGIGSAGSARHSTSTSPALLPPAKQAATTATQAPTTSPPPATPTTSQATPPITAPRTDCRWREYSDGAIGNDPDCAPGELDPAVTVNTAHTICNHAWVAATSKLEPPATTLDKLLIEYQLPGSPGMFAIARVIPVEDGGSPTSPMNLYPLPLDGYGGQATRAVVADELRNEICSHRITVTQAAKTLEGDWLSKGLPNHA
ncbi:MAG: hypothetical protein JO168_24510 [Solirubrobacterales bacterium]|nr:hypothetical protein [Solirubrobacterales bacterium]